MNPPANHLWCLQARVSRKEDARLRSLKVLGLFLVVLFALPASAQLDGADFAQTTRYDWRAKGKKPGNTYGLRLDLMGVGLRLTKWDTGDKVLGFTAGKDGGHGFVGFPGTIMDEPGGINAEFLFDPERSGDFGMYSTFGAVELDSPFEPGTVPDHFYGAGIQYVAFGNLNVFAYSGEGTGSSVRVSGNSVRVAVDVVDHSVSVTCLPEGASTWLPVDDFPLDSVPREFVAGAGVSNLPPKGTLAIGGVTTHNAYVGPAEKVLLGRLASVIDCEKKALAELKAAKFAEAKSTLEGCISSLENLISDVEKAQSEGILPPSGEDPLVKLDPKTNGVKVAKKLRNALKTDQKVLKKVTKTVDKGIPAISEKVLKKLDLAIQIKRLAGSWLKGQNLKKPKDLPPEE